jgi:hypothetical protein
MKNLITLFFLVFINGMLFSQITNDSKIVDFYGQERVDQMRNESPQLLNLLDKYISHGFKVEDVGHGKYLEFVPLTSISLTRKEGGEVSIESFLEDYQSTNFNPLNYEFFPTREYQIYKLSGVDKIIYILPQDIILTK